MEIVVKLTADPKLETLLDKLCRAIDLGNGLPFTAEQTAPVNPMTAGTMALPAQPATASSAPTAMPVSPAPVNPTPAGTTTASTTAPEPATPIAAPARTAPLPSAPVTATVPVATVAPVTTTTTPAAPAAPQRTAVPTAAPTYKLEDIQAAVGPLLMQGKGPQLQGLLAQFGVKRLPDIPAENLGAFATALRGLGAQI
ncbi:hypothetical protein [Caproicibacterium sp. XB1]|uniref:hypothetical protein n=1 Tax=Caproicibacterium sp. XB1 TaxID=3396405 RepID=UPI0039B6F91A